MKKLLKYGLSAGVILLCIMGITGAVLWYIWSSNLPYIGSLKEYNPPVITEVFSEDGQLIGRFWKEKRIVVSLEQVPKHLINAFIAGEDARFFEHEGVDTQSIFRAFFKNILAGKIEQGGSTITQQVTKDLLLKNPEKTYRRKAREAILSMQIEKNFSKERILFLYINQIYLGHGAYGVESAARTYFGKKASELNLAEAAMLAGLPQAPSRYSPITNFDKARARQKYVLGQMREEGYITDSQEQEALNTIIRIVEDEENAFRKSPYFTEHIRRYLEKEYGKDLLYSGGLKVYTTMDLGMQKSAREALSKGLWELDKREGYRGPIKVLSPEEIEDFAKEVNDDLMKEPESIGKITEGLVEYVDDENNQVLVSIGKDMAVLPLKEMKWARKPDPKVPYYSAGVKKVGDVFSRGDVILCKIIETMEEGPYRWKVSLEQKPKIQGAIFSIETGTGKVKAMVGGEDFYESQFNRAVQSRRQPGSAFKPIIYATALDRGMTPSTVILDAPYISKMKQDEDVWKPKNYDEEFFGPTLFRNALIHSMNVITVKILKTIGVEDVIDYARRMGIESDLTPDLSLALGSSGVSLEEITAAYAVFANNGMRVEPFFINRIEDRSGQIIEENQPSLKNAIPEDTSYIMTDLMKGVIAEGTGWRARALKRTAAGKTGTSNDLKDAWFIGFTPDLVAGVWVGYDDLVPMGSGETGSRAASPIWLYFMSEVLKDRPAEDFIAPEGVVFAKIDAESGLLASTYSKKTVFQSYKKGTEPKEYTPKPKEAKAGQFSQFDMDFSNKD